MWALRTTIKPTLSILVSLATLRNLPPVTEHWCFPSLLIDGHHKVFAAAKLKKPITMLTFLAIDDGTADSPQIDALPRLLATLIGFVRQVWARATGTSA
jgi:hypothetical protein